MRHFTENTAEELQKLRQSLEGVQLRSLLIALLILVAGILAVKLLMLLVGRLLRRTRLDSSLHRFIKSLLRVLLYFNLILIVASYLGIDVTSLVALLSVVSLAVSLSVQSVLSNVAGGMMVMGTKPFKRGDYVSVGELEGTVDEIGVVYTRLHTIDNRSVLIPNATVSTAVVQNFSALGKRRVEVVVSASYDSDPERVLEALRSAARRCEPLPEEEILAEIEDFGDSAISYHLHLWVPASQFLARRYLLRRLIWESFREAGVVMTYPHLNVHFDEKNEKEQAQIRA